MGCLHGYDELITGKSFIHKKNSGFDFSKQDLMEVGKNVNLRLTSAIKILGLFREQRERWQQLAVFTG